VGEEGIGEGFRWEGMVGSKGFEGFPSLVSLSSNEGFVECSLKSSKLVGCERE
jgi:hypothetical protein